MPTYQYACTNCGEQLEVVQRFTDDPLTVCPECNGKLRKLFSAVGVVFKGSGFYKTDSRSSSRSASRGDSSSDAKTEKKSESSSGKDSSSTTSSSDGSAKKDSGSGKSDKTVTPSKASAGS